MTDQLETTLNQAQASLELARYEVKGMQNIIEIQTGFLTMPPEAHEEQPGKLYAGYDQRAKAYFVRVKTVIRLVDLMTLPRAYKQMGRSIEGQAVFVKVRA